MKSRATDDSIDDDLRRIRSHLQSVRPDQFSRVSVQQIRIRRPGDAGRDKARLAMARFFLSAFAPAALIFLLIWVMDRL